MLKNVECEIEKRASVGGIRPQRHRFPIERIPHQRGDIEWGSLNQAPQLGRPSGFRSDLIQKPGEHRLEIVDQPCRFLVQLSGERQGFRLRQLEGDRKAAVPNAAVVGAEVSKGVRCWKPDSNQVARRSMPVMCVI